MIFLNHTNHPSKFWSAEQLNAAKEYGEIVDLPFPAVPAEAGREDVRQMAETEAEVIAGLKPAAVLCQGEFTYTVIMVHLLQAKGITVLASCSDRETAEWIDEEGNNRKESVFRFVRFREYI